MKKLSKYSISNRLSDSKENQQKRSSSQKYDFEFKLEEPIEEWKQISDRSIFRQTTNRPIIKRVFYPEGRRVVTSPELATTLSENNSKISQIEALKREAMLLQSQDFQSKRVKNEILKTQPLNQIKKIAIRLDNWLKTTNSEFFRSEQRHTILEKKRNKLRKLKKGYLPISSINKSHIKISKECKISEVPDLSKPLLVYPLTDTMYQQIKQRLRTPSIKSIHDFSVDRIRRNSIQKQPFRIITAKTETRPDSHIRITELRSRTRSLNFNF